MKFRSSDSRFTGAGVVYALFCVCCLVLGGTIGAAIVVAMQ